MKEQRKNKILDNLRIVGLHVEKYRISMIVLSSIIATIALFFAIFWELDETSKGVISDNLYLAGYIAFLVISVFLIIVLILNKYKIIKTTLVAIIIHIYVLLLIASGTLVCILDLDIGASPFLYLIIITFLAGLFIVEPIYYIVLVVASFATIMAFTRINNYAFFHIDAELDEGFGLENIIDIFIFVIIAVCTAFRQFHITIKEYKAQEKLTKLTYYDELTDLLNERSYLETINEISTQVENKNVTKFAIVMMDVNNLKATNDAFGHRYGCHLVVRCGHTLPSVFKTSKLFHVGGDEFIAIVYGKDLEYFDETMKLFKETLEYSLIQFEGQQLIFSVASGTAMYQEGDKFQDVLQRADDAMYINKKAIKEKYNMKARR